MVCQLSISLAVVISCQNETGNLCYNISMYSGGKHVFMMGFDLVRFLNLVQEHRVSKAFIVPPVILALAKHPIVDQYNLTSLKCVLSGAAPLSKFSPLCKKDVCLTDIILQVQMCSQSVKSA